MKKKALEWALLVAAFSCLIVVSVAEHPGGSISTYSSYDTGPNGYRVLYNVLARERIPVRRFEEPLGTLDGRAGVLVITDTAIEQRAGAAFGAFDANDVKRLHNFTRHGRLVLFAPASDPLVKEFRTSSVRFDAPPFTNAGLAKAPSVAANVFAAVAGRGIVAFDERIHGYVVDRSFWGALPVAVRAAVWIVCGMLLLYLIDANVRFEPPIDADLPVDRDSSSYLRSMGALLRRSGTARAVVTRFAEDANRLATVRGAAGASSTTLEELREIAALPLSARAIVRAARCYAIVRKELA